MSAELLRPGPAVGGGAGARRLVDRGPGGRDLPGEPGGRARPRRGAEERVMLRVAEPLRRAPPHPDGDGRGRRHGPPGHPRLQDARVPHHPRAS